jgi:hypothetical protein
LPKEEAAYRLARRLLSQQSGQHWRATGTCNQIKYGTTEPPAYDFSRITTPLALFTGELCCILMQTTSTGKLIHWNELYTTDVLAG